jgi:hypothetical protein
MFRALTLNKNIDCHYICKVVQDMINRNNEENGTSPDYVLSLRITKAIDAKDTKEILKLEDKSSECNT